MLLGLLHITSYVERENNFFSRTPLLRTLNLPPEGVRNNGSRPHQHFYIYVSCGGTVDSESSSVCHFKKTVFKCQRRTLK